MRASKFMDANELGAKETVPASRKLGRDEAQAILKSSSLVVIAKGKRLEEFRPKGVVDEDVVARMLGSTGNLRAPVLRAGKTTLVGFNEDAWTEALL